VDHAAMEYPPFERDFHREAPEIAALSEAEVEARRRMAGPGRTSNTISTIGRFLYIASRAER
jgi:hypothetical protein